MRNLLLVLIEVLVFVGCSKSFKEVKPEEEVDSSDLFASEIMQTYDISPNDTSGLKIFGFAYTKENAAILGNKNGHLWVQLLEDNLNGTFKKETNFIVNAKFNDWIEIDLGYGEKKVIEVNYLNWNDKLNSNYLYYIFWHDQEHFILTKYTKDFAWIVYKNKIFEKQASYHDVIANGYIGSFFDNKRYVCNEKEEPLYEYNGNGENFINLYEYILYSSSGIERRNAETGKVIWETQFEKMGEIIDGHEPKIESSMEIKDDVVSCIFNITNYDGSKETKIINVDIETGKIIKQ